MEFYCYTFGTTPTFLNPNAKQYVCPVARVIQSLKKTSAFFRRNESRISINFMDGNYETPAAEK